MSNLPLPGRIYFRENGEANSYALIDQDAIKWVMALLVNGEHTTSRQTKILERMAACWNACIGLNTEQIDLLADHYDSLKAQRDELVSALSPFVLANSSEEFVTLVVRSDDITKARAAITKTTEGAA